MLITNYMQCFEFLVIGICKQRHVEFSNLLWMEFVHIITCIKSPVPLFMHCIINQAKPTSHKRIKSGVILRIF
jgi:hypothetical protein